ncbi:MAG: hypothetical protein AB7P14_00340 [Blastocatellales bacterium]
MIGNIRQGDSARWIGSNLIPSVSGKLFPVDVQYELFGRACNLNICQSGVDGLLSFSAQQGIDHLKSGVTDVNLVKSKTMAFSGHAQEGVILLVKTGSKEKSKGLCSKERGFSNKKR